MAFEDMDGRPQVAQVIVVDVMVSSAKGNVVGQRWMEFDGADVRLGIDRHN